MRVVHVVRQYLPSVGGLEEVVRNLAQQQIAQGRYLPSVVTLNRVFRSDGAQLPAHAVLDGVPVQRLGFAGSERYPLCPQVAWALGQADVVHVHGIDFFFDYLALLHRVLRKPMLASTHGGFFHTPFASRLKKVYFQTVTRLSARAYEKVIATSENDGDVFDPILRTGQLQVIENGVDLEKFEGAGSAKLVPVMIYFGRWSVNKGLLQSLDVLAELCRQQPATGWRLIIAGRAYDLDAKELMQQARQRGVQDRIALHPNPDVQALRRLIGQASYFLCLSQHEGFGIAPIEAISAGLIPLLSPIPPFVRLLQTTHQGTLLDAPRSALQASQVLHLHDQLKSEDYCPAHARAAALAAVQCYSWTGVAQRYSAQYDLALQPLAERNQGPP